MHAVCMRMHGMYYHGPTCGVVAGEHNPRLRVRERVRLGLQWQPRQSNIHAARAARGQVAAAAAALARLFRLLERWREAIGLSHNLQRLSKLILCMLLFSHWDGCLLFLLAYLEGFPDNSWVVRAGALHDRDSLLDLTGFEQVSK